jgi:hypothetical protein
MVDNLKYLVKTVERKTFEYVETFESGEDSKTWKTFLLCLLFSSRRWCDRPNLPAVPRPRILYLDNRPFEIVQPKPCGISQPIRATDEIKQQVIKA